MGKKNYSLAFWDMKSMFHCSLVIFFIGGLATLRFYKNNNSEPAASSIISCMATETNTNTNIPSLSPPSPLPPSPPPPSLTDDCDLFSGRWVYDNKSHYPLYKEHECPYLHADLACQTWGRKDSKYQQWRWQPHDCDFPRFDGKAVVERLRGKRILFVGDSVNRNQWDSIICMVQSYIPGVKKVSLGELNHTLYTFRTTDYNISIDYYWAPMLVESNGDDPSNHRLDHRTIRSKSIEKHARHWVHEDVLVFNSYLWWRLPIVKILHSGSLLGGPNQVYKEVNNRNAYKMGLETWSKWLHTHIDPSKTKLFFMGLTATHSRATDWGGKRDQTCYGETDPVMHDNFWESGTDPRMLRILESSLNKLKAKGVNVEIINVTRLTQCRKDAHPTVYRKLWHPLTEEQKKNPARSSDCTHWCLPGVPDIWNELLLAYILR